MGILLILPGKKNNLTSFFQKFNILIHNILRELLVCSREGSMPRFLSGIHVTLKTPVIALIFEVRVTIILTSTSQGFHSSGISHMCFDSFWKY